MHEVCEPALLSFSAHPAAVPVSSNFYSFYIIMSLALALLFANEQI
jgi:hypothetical protein